MKRARIDPEEIDRGSSFAILLEGLTEFIDPKPGATAGNTAQSGHRGRKGMKRGGSLPAEEDPYNSLPPKFHAEQGLSQWISLDLREEETINYYTGNGYEKLNSWLRDGQPKDDPDEYEFTTRTGILDGVIAKNAMPENALLYRGVNIDRKTFDSLWEVFEGGNPNGENADKIYLSDPAYLSTTSSFDKGEKFAMSTSHDKAFFPRALLMLRVPKGMPYAAVASSGMFEWKYGEKEFLFPRNTRLRITKFQSTVPQYENLSVIYADMELPE